MMGDRSASINRETNETKVNVNLNIDGTGRFEITTGTYMMDHLLSQLAKHGLFDITIVATGDNIHHIVEDIAICLGKAFNEAFKDKKGITRVGSAVVPMDEAIATVTVDISGRPYSVINAKFIRGQIDTLPSDLIKHFLVSLATEARITLHASILDGTNEHHKAEALFKALGRALDAATRIDQRSINSIPSTKGTIE
jgi:imidazoleglycerol-phosphate dehydratase